jgi:hypothetical protein
MNLPLTDRMEHAKLVRAALEARLGDAVDSKLVHYTNASYYDDDLPTDNLSEEAVFPRIEVRILREVVTLDFRPSKIVVRWFHLFGRRGAAKSTEIAIDEGIGGRTVVQETDEQIVEDVINILSDLRLRTNKGELKQVRKEMAALREREATMVAALADIKAAAKGAQP